MRIVRLMDKALRETSPQSPLPLVLPFPCMVKWPLLRDLCGFTTAKNFFQELEAFIGYKERAGKKLVPCNP